MRVWGTENEKPPTLSPKLFMSSNPNPCIRLSITFAIGVPSFALMVDAALQQAVRSPHQEEGAAPVVVNVAVGHGRTVHNQGLVQEIGITLHRVLQPVEEVCVSVPTWCLLIAARSTRISSLSPW